MYNYNTIQYNTTQYNTIQYNTIQYNTIQYNTMQCNEIQCNAMQYNTMQYNTMSLSRRTVQYRHRHSINVVVATGVHRYGCNQLRSCLMKIIWNMSSSKSKHTIVSH